ncbi:MAG TPA: MOSC domain-containing protein [Thermoanaerobaculia bacterium]|nr:MOSC domain-containing protein [Thermoanaerobaculia bacterium]
MTASCVGRVREIVRYPVKSMAGVPAASAVLGFHGLDGDRRFAFRRVGDAGGFPWLSASRVPELVLYRPEGVDANAGEPLPTHVRAPGGESFALGEAALAAEIAGRLGEGVELMRLRNGIFDEAALSVIALATIAGIGREVGLALDPRRFRANVLLETESAEPFLEDAWVGGTLFFGEGDGRPAVGVTACDPRCVMINLDPETAERDGRVFRTVGRLNRANAGVYATVIRCGTIRVGDRVDFEPGAGAMA